MKKCKECFLEKTINDFCKKSSTQDGLNIFCRRCHSKRNIEWQRKNKDKRKLICANFYKRNRAVILPRNIAYNASKRDEVKARSAKRYLKNKDEIGAKNRAWASANPGRVAAKTRRYQAKKLNACPGWVDKSKIEDIYALANDLQWLSEEPLEVDHIIPLQGKNVSGLHVHWNLQIIPRSENRRKSANF